MSPAKYPPGRRKSAPRSLVPAAAVSRALGSKPKRPSTQTTSAPSVPSSSTALIICIAVVARIPPISTYMIIRKPRAQTTAVRGSSPGMPRIDAAIDPAPTIWTIR